MTAAPTTISVIISIRNSWIRIFREPTSIPTDRGSCFTSTEFQQFITEELGAYLIKSSPQYPQGNAINEACHKGLEKSIASAIEQGSINYEEMLQDAIAIHNSVPHSSTGQSPYFLLFGFEPVFPGLQAFRSNERLTSLKNGKSKEGNLSEGADRSISRISQKGHPSRRLDRLLKARKQARSPEDDEVPTASKYNAPRSLPAKVLKISDNKLTCQPWDQRALERGVFISATRVLKGDVPYSLQQINTDLLERYDPKSAAASAAYTQQTHQCLGMISLYQPGPNQQFCETTRSQQSHHHQSA